MLPPVTMTTLPVKSGMSLVDHVGLGGHTGKARKNWKRGTIFCPSLRKGVRNEAKFENYIQRVFHRAT